MQNVKSRQASDDSFTLLSRSFSRTKSREAIILVQHFHGREANGAQQVELKDQGTRSVFLGDISKNMVAIRDVFKLGQIRPVAFPHERLHSRMPMFDQIMNPYPAPGPEGR